MTWHGLLTGGSMEHTGKCRRSLRPWLFSGVMAQSDGGRQAMTFSENGSHGMLYSCSNTWATPLERRKSGSARSGPWRYERLQDQSRCPLYKLVPDERSGGLSAYLGLDVLVADRAQGLDVMAHGVPGSGGPRVHGHEDALVAQGLALPRLDPHLWPPHAGTGKGRVSGHSFEACQRSSILTNRT